MKSFFSTAFLMAAGAVLFVAFVVIAGALLMAGALKKGRLGEFRIDISKDECAAGEAGLNPAQSALILEARKCAHRADESIREIEKAAGKFADRAERGLGDAEKNLAKARARVAAAPAHGKADPAAEAALKTALDSLGRREKLVLDLRALLAGVEEARKKLDLEMTAMRVEDIKKRSEARAAKTESPAESPRSPAFSRPKGQGGEHREDSREERGEPGGNPPEDQAEAGDWEEF